MEKQKAPLLPSIILCFNPSFYPKVLRQSGLRSFLYLGFICLIVYGFLGHRLGSALFDRNAEMISRFYERALPPFHFENGEADYPPGKPHLHQEKEGKTILAVIVDTSGQTEEVGEEYDGGILITRTEIVTKDLRGRQRREAIPTTATKVTVKEFFIERMREQKPRAVLTMTFHAYLFQLVAKLVLVSLVAGVLLLGDKGKSRAYPFAYYFNVGCYAVTPFVLSGFVRGGVTGSVATWVSYGVALMLFLSLAVSGLIKCRHEDAKELESTERPAVWTEEGA
jgi:hypothetical protein